MAQDFQITLAPEDQAAAEQIQAAADRGMAFLDKKEADPAISAFKIALTSAPEGSPVRDILTHNLLTAYKMRVNQLLDARDPVQVNRYLPEISALRLTSPLARDPEFRERYADTLRTLSLDFYNARQHDASLFFVRQALALNKSPGYYIDLANALAWTKKPAQLRDYTTDYDESALGRHVFITCAPKSGSTFLKNVLVAATGFRDMFSVYASLQNEQELDLPHLIKFGNQNTVTQQHARASEPNVQMMQAFGIRPTVLVRDIFDTVASLLDFYTNGYVFSTYFDRDEFVSFPHEQKVDLLIEYVVPWYFQFVASWQRIQKAGRLELHWVTYEAMVADKPGTVEEILEFYRIQAPPERIVAAIREIEGDKERNRFNKGRVGRGDSVLTPQQRARIIALARHFPSADFRLLGVSDNASA